MTKPSANLRLFVAVYPPRELVEQWASRIKAMDLPAYRLTPVEQVHMTVQFVGDTPASELDDTIESCLRSTKGLHPFPLTAREFITLPEKGRARLIAVETDPHSTLLEIKRRLALRLATNVRGDPTKSKNRRGNTFRPHLTVCRFKSPSHVRDFDRELPSESFDVKELMLMKSVLKPSGAEHEVLERCALG
jgi:RNA 2',3'-cyclic 3'-phosphodiesterase